MNKCTREKCAQYNNQWPNRPYGTVLIDNMRVHECPQVAISHKTYSLTLCPMCYY